LDQDDGGGSIYLGQIFINTKRNDDSQCKWNDDVPFSPMTHFEITLNIKKFRIVDHLGSCSSLNIKN
jgi:hypothetical protein